MTETKRLRRPAEGGYARGEETRLRIIEAAIEMFGEHGFAAASTREIAARAGVNAPALQYYFENKEGVYRACAEYLASEVWQQFEPVITHARAALASTDDIDPLIEAFIGIQSVMIDRTLATQKAPTLKLFFVREQAGQEPPIASEIFQERVRGPMNQVAAGIIGKVGGTLPDDPLTVVRMLTLHGQFLAFHMAPRSVLTALGWPMLDPDKVEFVKQTIFSNTRMMLRTWAAERETRAAQARAAGGEKKKRKGRTAP